MYSALIYRI